MSAYMFMVLVHVAAAFALLSTSIVGVPAVRAAVRHARTTDEIRAYLTFGRPLSVLAPASAMVVLASGFYLTAAVRFWTMGWVQVAMALWVVNALLALFLEKPATARLAAAAFSPASPEINPGLDRLRWTASWSFGSDFILANDAATLVLMVIKPGLVASTAIVSVAGLLAVCARLILNRRRAPLALGAPPSPMPALTPDLVQAPAPDQPVGPKAFR